MAVAAELVGGANPGEKEKLLQRRKRREDTGESGKRGREEFEREKQREAWLLLEKERLLQVSGGLLFGYFGVAERDWFGRFSIRERGESLGRGFLQNEGEVSIVVFKEIIL